MLYFWIEKARNIACQLCVVVLLSFNVVEGMEKQEPTHHMTASEAHLRSLMAHLKNDQDYYHKDFNTILEEFFNEYVGKGFKEKELILDEDSHLKPYFKDKIQVVLKEEAQYEQRKWYTVYHAMDMYYAFVMDIMTELRRFIAASICNKIGSHTVNFRTLWKQASCATLEKYIFEKRQEVGEEDNFVALANFFRSQNSPCVLSINFFFVWFSCSLLGVYVAILV